ncbi:MAG: NADH-quinone oxidoreductase subunit N [Opitutales bacterium]|nr:NADH-quinone oxidoreductase subunit N [Opitutales bacterium]
MDAFKAYAEANDWTLLLPELVLACGALLLLCREALRKAEEPPSGGGLVFLLQGGLLLYAVLSYLSIDPNFSITAFNGLIKQGYREDAMRCFFLGCALLTSLLATPFLRDRRLPEAEFHAIISLAAAGMMLLVQSNHFLMLFVSLETVAVCFYVLVGYHRGSAFSLEAGLKYLVFGAMSSAILLFGITLLYGTAGNPNAWGDLAVSSASPPDALSFDWLGKFIEANAGNLALRAGTAFLLAGLAFKLGAVPFQTWVPDVYQGAPTPVTAYLAVASKGAGFVVLFNLVTGPLAGLHEFLVPVLSLVAVVTILIGNLGALAQRNVKRLMGFSGVAHAGYLLVGVIAAMHPQVPEHRVFWAIAFYLLTYFLASYGVFGVMGLVAGSEDVDQRRAHYASLAQRQPFLAFVLAVSLGSLAGIPPLAGFIGKLLLFVVVFQAGLHGLFAAMVIGVVLSIFYYFGWIREAVFPPSQTADGPDDEGQAQPPTIYPYFRVTCVLGLLAIVTIVLGFYQGSLGASF